MNKTQEDLKQTQQSKAKLKQTSKIGNPAYDKTGT